jgi:hypothetical protein
MSEVKRSDAKLVGNLEPDTKGGVGSNDKN